MKSALTALLLIACALATTACETVKGVGRDVTNAGEAMDRTF